MKWLKQSDPSNRIAIAIIVFKTIGPSDSKLCKTVTEKIKKLSMCLNFFYFNN